MFRLLQRSTVASVGCRFSHTAAAIIPSTRTTTPLIQPSYRIQSRLFSTVPPSPSSSTQSTPSSDANANSSKKPEDDEEFDEEPQAKKKQGPQAVTWKSVTFLVVVGGATVAYLLWNQERALNTVRMDSIGTPKIGGPWSLTNDQGKRVTSADLHGKYPLIYFGFTHCPDICPRELERMDEVIQKIDAAKLGHHIVPLFITIDPKRDTVARMREYKKKWNPRIQFLVPTDEELKDLSAKFRLYYSASETNPGEEDDYLLDHSIFFYMMDREGKFMDVFSQYTTTDDVAFKIASNIKAENK